MTDNPTNASDGTNITDAELAAVDGQNVRVSVENLLRLKRVGPEYAKLLQIAEMVSTRLAEAQRVANLEQHITKNERVKALRSLEATVAEQLRWHRAQVVVHRHEVNALVTRWLLLQYPVL